MNIKEMSSADLRKYCLEHGLNFLDVLTQGIPAETEAEKTSEKKEPKKDIKPKKAPKPKTQKPLSPKNLVTDWLDIFRESFPNETLDALAKFVGDDLKNTGIDYDENCGMVGFVANVLYEHAGDVKYQNLQPRAKAERRIEDPVRTEELEELLRYNFGVDSKRICGIISRGDVIKDYSPNKNRRFRNEDGEYNIEGTRCWEGKNKEEIRNKLAEIVAQKLFESIALERLEREDALSEERDRIRAKIDEINAGSEQRSDKINLKMKIPNKGINRSIHRQFIRAYFKGEEAYKLDWDESGHDLIFHLSKEDVDPFMKKWGTFTRRYSQFGEEVKIRQVKFGSKKRHNLETKLQDIETELEFIEREKPVFHYLGLEGPNFASYIQLANAADEKGVELHALVPEYNHRLANIMKSLAESGVNSALQNVLVEQKNIDDMILLDFATDSNLRIESNGGFHVRYGEEKIELEKYHRLLDDIDAGVKTQGHMVDEYGVSGKFIGVASERRKGTFDIVFLDYVGGVTDKRDKVLETLIKRRIKDKSVVAVTSNLNPKVNHKELVDRIPEFHFERVFEITAESDFEPMEFEGQKYQDGAHEMYFNYYYLERKSAK